MTEYSIDGIVKEEENEFFNGKMVVMMCGREYINGKELVERDGRDYITEE